MLRLNDYTGTIQWQQSYDNESWTDVDNATQDTLLFIADTTTYFKALVTVGICDPFVSDIAEIIVSSGQTTNQAPVAPNAPQPANEATAVGIDITLEWNASDPDGDDLTYDMYLDDFDASTLVSQNQSENSYKLENLEYNTGYYWRVVAKDGNGKETSSAYWKFYTSAEVISDVEGNTYEIATIGNQTWMAENLATTRLNDGSQIDFATDDNALNQGNSEIPSYFWYDNDEATYKDTYDALYNWYAVETGKLCPDGWHVPSDEEWKELEIFLGMSQYQVDQDGLRGTNEGIKPAGDTSLLHDEARLEENAAFGSSGFKAFPGGYLLAYRGSFSRESFQGTWWTSSEENSSLAWYRIITEGFSNVNRGYTYKRDGRSVRCVKDE